MPKINHPAYQKIVDISCYPDPLAVKEPAQNYRLLSEDGDLWYTGHQGLDAWTNWHAPIYAVADGVGVDCVNWGDATGAYGSSGSGTYVSIQTNGCVGCVSVTAYKHLSVKTINNGDVVTKGQLIGYQGGTGNVPEHLHFDIFIDGVRYDPVPYLQGDKSFQVIRGNNLVNIAVFARYKYVDSGWLNIRSEPSASSADVGDITQGSEFDVNALMDNEGYTWGKLSDGRGYVAIYKGADAWCIPIEMNDNSEALAVAEAQIEVLTSQNALLEKENTDLTAENDLLEQKIDNAIAELS
jgi:hypothetical protein